MGGLWYLDGKLLKKVRETPRLCAQASVATRPAQRNTFDDFIACAEHLVSRPRAYVSPGRCK
jgi:protease II